VTEYTLLGIIGRVRMHEAASRGIVGTPSGRPFLRETATTTVAFGRGMSEGLPLPPGWVLAPEGLPSKSADNSCGIAPGRVDGTAG
jgi:hypothetical protein